MEKLKQLLQKIFKKPQSIDPEAILVKTEDECVNNVLEKMISRSNQGMIKFGLTIKKNNKPTLAWIEDTQEELLDATIYLERLKNDFKK